MNSGRHHQKRIGSSSSPTMLSPRWWVDWFQRCPTLHVLPISPLHILSGESATAITRLLEQHSIQVRKNINSSPLSSGSLSVLSLVSRSAFVKLSTLTDLSRALTLTGLTGAAPLNIRPTSAAGTLLFCKAHRHQRFLPFGPVHGRRAFKFKELARTTQPRQPVDSRVPSCSGGPCASF